MQYQKQERGLQFQYDCWHSNLTAITVETEVKRRKLEEKHTKPAVKRRKLQEKHIKPGKIREEDYNSLSRGPNGTDFS